MSWPTLYFKQNFIIMNNSDWVLSYADWKFEQEKRKKIVLATMRKNLLTIFNKMPIKGSLSFYNDPDSIQFYNDEVGSVAIYSWDDKEVATEIYNNLVLYFKGKLKDPSVLNNRPF